MNNSERQLLLQHLEQLIGKTETLLTVFDKLKLKLKPIFHSQYNEAREKVLNIHNSLKKLQALQPS